MTSSVPVDETSRCVRNLTLSPQASPSLARMTPSSTKSGISVSSASSRNSNTGSKNKTRGKKKTTGPLHNSRYKAKMCKNWMENGSCPYFEKCQFAHGMHELEKWAARRMKREIGDVSPLPSPKEKITEVKSWSNDCSESDRPCEEENRSELKMTLCSPSEPLPDLTNNSFERMQGTIRNNKSPPTIPYLEATGRSSSLSVTSQSSFSSMSSDMASASSYDDFHQAVTQTRSFENVWTGLPPLFEPESLTRSISAEESPIFPNVEEQGEQSNLFSFSF